MCDAGMMSWDLTIDKQIAFNVGYGASKLLRDAEAFAMYWHAEGMKSAYSGTITFNGRQYTSHQTSAMAMQTRTGGGISRHLGSGCPPIA